MTEAEWLACTDPWEMLTYLDATNERKARLVLAACCRVHYNGVASARLYPALDAAERHADGRLAASTLSKYKRELGQIRTVGPKARRVSRMNARWARNLFILAATPLGSSGWQPIPQAIEAGIIIGDFSPLLTSSLPPILRDIFGNPFHPVTFSPEWRTDTAVTLARQMYDSRDFGAMPILADALQDAGCENEDILSHCRCEGPHVRGCWVVDLVLDKA